MRELRSFKLAFLEQTNLLRDVFISNFCRSAEANSNHCFPLNLNRNFRVLFSGRTVQPSTATAQRHNAFFIVRCSAFARVHLRLFLAPLALPHLFGTSDCVRDDGAFYD